MARRRLDAELVRRGLARSRDQATDLIHDGQVSVGGTIASKPATQVDTGAPIVVREQSDDPGFASRGGHKLQSALDVFGPLGLKLSGRRALDAGASTGGFTDVLLRADVTSVVAVDVGYGQLAWPLQQDPRVTVLDRTNVRNLTRDQLPSLVDLVVADLSFISLTLVLPALIGVCEPTADLVVMVKPQFEVGREKLGSGGVVRDPDLRAAAVRTIAGCALNLGWGTQAVTASQLPGPSGNVEYFLWLHSGAPPIDESALLRAVAEGPT